VSASSRTTANLVIGGGLAGSMVGLRLAAAGREVTLLERERAAHHKVCGEFLSREAVELLRQAGVDPLDLGAEQIRAVRLVSRRQIVETALPFAALSLSRCVLDEALHARAKQAGCRVERGAFVESLERREGLWESKVRGGESCFSPTVFLASGKHDLRGQDRGKGAHGDLVGFKLYWRLAPRQTDALRGMIELILFKGGYGGLSLVENGVANFCLVVRRSVLRGTGGWNELLAAIRKEVPHFACRLDGATALWERPLAVSSIPYGYLIQDASGLWCVGDQAAVIPSFTGDGMSIALHSANLAVQMYLDGASVDRYNRELRRHLSSGMRLATVLSRAMVTQAGRALAPMGLSIFPDAMNWIARSTRIPERALRQTQIPSLEEQRPAAL
jgi:flavin-dependent dehydrogenase